MNAEEAQPESDHQWEMAEDSRVEAEGERQLFERGRQDAEKQRNVNESTRQVGEKQREIGEQLRESERTSERLMAEYSIHTVVERIEHVEMQCSWLVVRLESVEALLKRMQEQLQQLRAKKE